MHASRRRRGQPAAPAAERAGTPCTSTAPNGSHIDPPHTGAGSADTAPSGEAPASAGRDAYDIIARELARRIGPHKYEMWFGQTALRIDSGELRVETDSPFVARWIEGHYADDLADVTRAALGEAATVQVSVCRAATQDAEADETSPERSAPAAPADRGASRAGRAGRAGAGRRSSAAERDGAGPAEHRLETFIVGESNRLAYTAAARLAEDPRGSSISPLFIHGECGLGKTHLLKGVCHQLAADRTLRVRYVTGEQFTNQYIQAVQNNTIESFRARYRRLDVLAIDDVHFLANKVKTQNEFLHTLDEINLTGARIVLASDEHPRHIRRFSEALISRFLSGMVVQIDRPDRSLRIELVRRLAQQRGLRLGDAAVQRIADRCIGSVRELQGVITKLAALYELTGGDGTGGEVGMLLTDQLLAEFGCQQPAVRLKTIVQSVCGRVGVNQADLLGSGRHKRVVLARGLVAYLGREMTAHSFPEIAGELGRRCHSTVHTAAGRVKKQLEDDDEVVIGHQHQRLPLRDLVDQLRHTIVRCSRPGP